MKKLNILRVIGSLNPTQGGPLEGLRQSTAIFSKLGHVTEVVTLDEIGSPWLADEPFKIHAIGKKISFYSYSPRLLTWLCANAPRFDVVIQHGLWNYTAFATGRALKHTKTPYFVFTHGMLDPWFRDTYPLKHIAKQILWWISEGPLLRGAQAVLFTTEEERVLARNSFFPYKIKERVVAYGTADVSGDSVAQVESFRRLLPSLGQRRFLLFLGRIHPKKGCDLLIRAFARIAIKNSDLDLVIAGPDQIGWRRDLEAIADIAGIRNRIHWPGFIIGDAKWGAYRACEAFVLPSHQENFGIAVAEAMACSKAVLITDKVNIWREIKTAGAGLVAADDQAGVNSLLEEFISTTCNVTFMAKAARRIFLQKFEIEETAIGLLNTILESRSSKDTLASGKCD